MPMAWRGLAALTAFYGVVTLFTQARFMGDTIDYVVEASLGYYRAMLQFPLTHPEESQRVQFEKTTVPTLTVFGAHDPGHELSADEDSFYEAEHRLEVIPDAGHFVQREQPERLTELIVDWFEKE